VFKGKKRNTKLVARGPQVHETRGESSHKCCETSLGPQRKF